MFIWKGRPKVNIAPNFYLLTREANKNPIERL